MELFYYDTEEIKPVTEDQKKDLENRKNVINRTSKLYTLLNIYITQYNKLTEDQKKTASVPDRPENLSLGFSEDDSPPVEGDEEVKLESKEIVSEKVKLNP